MVDSLMADSLLAESLTAVASVADSLLVPETVAAVQLLVVKAHCEL